MKVIKISYWVPTVIIALMMVYSAYAYLSQPMMADAFHHLGFPDYFRVELAIAKIAGAIILLAPLSGVIKEWAYAGFTFAFISALIAHSTSGDPIQARVMPVIFLLLLALSYVMYHKINKQKA